MGGGGDRHSEKGVLRQVGEGDRGKGEKYAEVYHTPQSLLRFNSCLKLQ